ncbi:MAG: ABC transporter permease [Myxococcaceae bacterium]
MRVPSTLRIAWRNLGRNKRRTALALTAIGTAQLALVLYSAIVNGYADYLVRTITGPLVGHVQVHAPKWREERALDLTLPNASGTLETLRQDPEVALASGRVYAPALAAVGEEGFAVLLLGVDPALESRPDSLLSGVPGEQLPRDRRVLVGRGLAQTLKLEPGAQLALVGQAADGSVANELFEVSGLLASDIDLVNRLGVIAALPAAQELLVMPDAVHEIVVRGRDPKAADALASHLGALPQLRGTEVLSWRQLVPELYSMVGLLGAASFIILVLVFVSAAAGVANTMMMSTFERTHELGMVLALGAKPSRLVRLVVTEAFFLGFLGVAIGTALGLLAVWLGSGGIDMSAAGGVSGSADITFGGVQIRMLIVPRAQASDALNGVAAVVLTSLIASLWPAARAARLEPGKAMRE